MEKQDRHLSHMTKHCSQFMKFILRTENNTMHDLFHIFFVIISDHLMKHVGHRAKILARRKALHLIFL